MSHSTCSRIGRVGDNVPSTFVQENHDGRPQVLADKPCNSESMNNGWGSHSRKRAVDRTEATGPKGIEVV